MGEKVTGLWWVWKKGAEGEVPAVVDACDLEDAVAEGAAKLNVGRADVVVKVCDPWGMQALLDTDTHKYADINEDMLREIRAITDAAGHDGVPFLDDAVRNLVAERDQAIRNQNHNATAIANKLAADMGYIVERLGFSLRADDQRPEGAPRFTAHIPGAGRGDGHTPGEAIDKLKARLVENAGPVRVVQEKRAEAERVAEAMNSGLIDIWTDLGKPEIGPESFVGALAAACRRAIADLMTERDIILAEITMLKANGPEETAKAHEKWQKLRDQLAERARGD